MWFYLYLFLPSAIKIMQILEVTFWRSNGEKKIVVWIVVWWNKCSMKNQGLWDQPGIDASPSQWIPGGESQTAVGTTGNLPLRPALLAPQNLLLDFPICFFLSAEQHQINQFYMYLRLLLAKNQVIPLRCHLLGLHFPIHQCIYNCTSIMSQELGEGLGRQW